MDYRHILFEQSGGLARLTLNRPDRLNSFNAAMHAEVADAISGLDGVRVLVLTGAGRGFCAGQDLADDAVSAGADGLASAVLPASALPASDLFAGAVSAVATFFGAGCDVRANSGSWTPRAVARSSRLNQAP